MLQNSSEPDWQKAGHHYFPLGLSMRREFGCPVWKVSIDAGFSCPNVTENGKQGCIFCDNRSFAPSRRLQTAEMATRSIHEQIDEGIKQLQRRYKADQFIAYFQPSTNTNASPEHLDTIFRSALAHPKIVGLALGTRPDALPETVLDVLERIAGEQWLQLEIGLQSIHDRTLQFLQRGHDYTDFLDAFCRCRRRGIRICVHLILGLPGETRADVLATAREMARLNPESVKLHNLYIAKGTLLAELWRAGAVPLPTLEEYASLVVDFLEILPPDMVIERISGEADSGSLLAPDWSRIKHAARNAIDQEFRRRNSRQGKR